MTAISALARAGAVMSLSGLVLPCADCDPAVYLEDRMANSKELRKYEEPQGRSRQFQ